MIMCYLYIRTKVNPVRDYRSVETMARKHEGLSEPRFSQDEEDSQNYKKICVNPLNLCYLCAEKS
jgi:hypothetical protein